jgi:hypothetical protein
MKYLAVSRICSRPCAMTSTRAMCQDGLETWGNQVEPNSGQWSYAFAAQEFGNKSSSPPAGCSRSLIRPGDPSKHDSGY